MEAVSICALVLLARQITASELINSINATSSVASVSPDPSLIDAGTFAASDLEESFITTAAHLSTFEPATASAVINKGEEPITSSGMKRKATYLEEQIKRENDGDLVDAFASARARIRQSRRANKTCEHINSACRSEKNCIQQMKYYSRLFKQQLSYPINHKHQQQQAGSINDHGVVVEYLDMDDVSSGDGSRSNLVINKEDEIEIDCYTDPILEVLATVLFLCFRTMSGLEVIVEGLGRCRRAWPAHSDKLDRVIKQCLPTLASLAEVSEDDDGKGRSRLSTTMISVGKRKTDRSYFEASGITCLEYDSFCYIQSSCRSGQRTMRKYCNHEIKNSLVRVSLRDFESGVTLTDDESDAAKTCDLDCRRAIDLWSRLHPAGAKYLRYCSCQHERDNDSLGDYGIFDGWENMGTNSKAYSLCHAFVQSDFWDRCGHDDHGRGSEQHGRHAVLLSKPPDRSFQSSSTAKLIIGNGTKFLAYFFFSSWVTSFYSCY